MSIDRNRRKFLRCTGAGLLLATPALGLAARLPGTPAQTPGPFYPHTPPLDDDNDLVQVAGQTRLAHGTVTLMRGRVLNTAGNAIAGARVEIWQCDANGRYHHERDRRDAALDPAFQGFGHTLCNTRGEYLFRTIKPAAYPGRTPHIHYKVIVPDGGTLTTQMYVADEPRNADDFLYQHLDPAARERVTVALAPDASSAELTGQFDIVI